MKKIGITGGIGTGKSTFLKLLQELGFKVFSCDEEVKALYKDSKIKKKIVQLFGKEILTSQEELNKKLISKKILENQVLKKKLEGLLHPLVKKRLDKFLKNAQISKEKIVFVEVPLLFEAGWDKLFDEIWVVTCSPKVQIKRLLERGLSLEEAQAFIKAQLPLSEKEKRADRVFSSETSVEKWKKDLKTILTTYLQEDIKS